MDSDLPPPFDHAEPPPDPDAVPIEPGDLPSHPLVTDIQELLSRIGNEGFSRRAHLRLVEDPSSVQEIHGQVFRYYQELASDPEAQTASNKDKQWPPPAPPVDLNIDDVPREWYIDEPPARQYLLRDAATGEGVLPRGKTCLFLAAGGVGKTTALCHIAVSVATGTAFLDAWVPDRPGRVLIVLGEEDEDETRRRLYWAAKIVRQVPDPGAIAVAPMHGIDCTLLEQDEAGDPAETEYLVSLRERIAQEGYDLVILDPLSHFAGGEAESKNAWATRLHKAFASLTLASGATILVAHHTPQWSRMQSRDPEEAMRQAENPGSTVGRGVTAITDNARWSCVLTPVEIKDEASGATASYLTLALNKVNYGRKDLAPINCVHVPEFQGALMPIDVSEIKALIQGQQNATTIMRMRKKRDAREEVRQETQAKREQARRVRAEQREAERRDRDAGDDAAAQAVLESDPGISTRDLTAEVKRRRACGTERASDAIRRVRRREGQS